MILTTLLLLLLQAPVPPPAAPPDEREARIRAAIEAISVSGRVVEIGEKREKLDDPRRRIAPGSPPLLSFRYFQGADRHRFGKLDLMLDDAGH